jgi:hypothetical protein
MSQLSFNLLAIAVFVITMSAVLGPLVHLSPVVPAIAVAGAMGLATLDNLGWQGQGLTLLLDWLAGFSAEHRTRVAQHEAGHFLVASLLDIPVTGYTLTAWKALRQGYPGQAGVRFDTQELEAELQQSRLSAQLVDRYCTIWMAGIAAESLLYDTVEGGGDDRTKLRQVLSQLGLPNREIQQKERGAILRAQTLLKEHRATYDALVEAIAEHASVSDCTAIIETAGAGAKG